MIIYTTLIRLVSPLYPKAKLWYEGRRDMLKGVQRLVGNGERLVWIHVASLGDFEQGRPIVDYIHDNYPEYKILLTFFSPSGYEVRKNYKNADHVLYIPADTRREVCRFLDIVQPDIAIFVKYEFWLNMLAELRKRKVRTFIVSAIFRRNSIFFSTFGAIWRKALYSFEKLFVQNEWSKSLLAELGVENVEVAGDTRFDRVVTIANGAEKVDIIEQFKGDKRLFVAGSTWRADEDIIIPLINTNPDIKFVIAPHEMDEVRIERIIREVNGGAVRYTRLSQVDFTTKQVLVLDTIGLLSSVYGSANWAYIGGGFGAGIHNTLEAAVYGLPITFGTNYGKFKEAHDLISLGVATPIDSSQALKNWFTIHRDNDEYLKYIEQTAKEYIQTNCGATKRIINKIFGKQSY